MTIQKPASWLVIAAVLGGMHTAAWSAQPDPTIKNTFVHLGNNVPAVLYEPVKAGPKSQIALLVTHGGDYLTFSACTELSRRGYRVLCEDPSGSGLDRTLLETKLGVDYLRAYPGVKKVLLFGHSGGATIVTAYQAVAENGVKFCQDEKKIHKCPANLAGLTPADGLVLPDPNWGNAVMALFSVDPAIVDESTGQILDPQFDMYSPANGFKAGGTSYSPAFTRKFLAAEGQRYDRIVRLAEFRLAAIEAGKGLYSDDERFDVPGASGLGPNNKLYSQDTRLLSRSRKPYPLVKADGSTVVQIIHSARRAENAKSRTDTFGLAASKSTIREFLNGSAVRVDPDFGYDEESIHGVQWTSSYATGPGNVESISAPLLAMGMTGHWEALAAEEIYEHAKSSDKSIAFIEGASHMYTTCKECERTPGEFGDTTKTTYDYIDSWLSKPGRF
jgi:pimeloyl-ACP methyl ester carboxylesterase